MEPMQRNLKTHRLCCRQVSTRPLHHSTTHQKRKIKIEKSICVVECGIRCPTYIRYCKARNMLHPILDFLSSQRRVKLLLTRGRLTTFNDQTEETSQSQEYPTESRFTPADPPNMHSRRLFVVFPSEQASSSRDAKEPNSTTAGWDRSRTGHKRKP